MNKLDKARQEINEIDKTMAELFERRMNAAKEVAEYKKENGLPVFDAGREEEVIKRNSEYVKDPEVKAHYVNFLKNTMNVSKDYQRKLLHGMRIAYSGVEGAFGYIAAKTLFPDSEVVAYSDFTDAYKAVESGECDNAVLPIENSYAGDVGAVMDLIFSGSLYINAITDIPVVHNLIACENATVESIKTVTSHPQALSQCAEYIKNRGYGEIACSNTAIAAKQVAEKNDPTLAAIASAKTASIYGLKILESGINTSRNNTTRFAVFSRTLNMPEKAKKMGENFILVFTVKNEAGALAKTLDIMGAFGFNLRNLRSRPMKELIWNYYFYIEAEGNINTPDGGDMLKALGATCDKLKLVGTYKS
jgi:chorismate mutase/prephenate dehydratase